MKKIIEHLQQNWIRYGFESIAILISILAAFALNNWNEERKARLKESAMIKEINYEFSENKKQFELVKQEHTGAYRSSLWMMDHWPISDTINTDSLGFHFRNTFSAWTFNPSQSNIETLINTESFDIIQNEELRRILVRWKDVLIDYQENEFQSASLFINTYAEYFQETLDYELLFQENKVNPAIFKSTKVKNILYRRSLTLGNIVNSREIIEVEKMINRIIELTSEE